MWYAAPAVLFSLLYSIPSYNVTQLLKYSPINEYLDGSQFLLL